MNAQPNDPFPPVSKADWIAQIGRELKDPAAYQSLQWVTTEGFTLAPFYTAEDWDSLPLARLQQAQKAVPDWLNTPRYSVSATGGAAHRDALEAGADALWLDLKKLPDLDTNALSRLLNGIKLADIPVFFEQQELAAHFVQLLQTVAPYQLKGGLLQASDATTAEATRLTADSPAFRTVCVSGNDFHNAGATAAEELAFLLARLTDVYDQLTEQGLSIAELLPKTMLSVSVGTGYFMEIAKLRALRVLWQRFLTAWGLKDGLPAAFVHAQTSAFYESTATPYNNLLRATTEAMAAVIGGCDVLTVRPYDALLTEPGAFSQRIARNVSLLMAHESHLDKVADPSAGSYYIETLTHQLTEQAWALFLEVEARGGLLKAGDLVKGRLDRSYEARQQMVRNGRVLVGVTKFRADEPGNNQPDVLAESLPEKTARRLALAFE